MLNRLGRISPAQLRWILNYAGVLILSCGFVVAAVIWSMSPNTEQKGILDPSNPSAPLSTIDSGKQSRQIEIYYGKTGLLMERWRDSLESVSHGKPLAKLVLVISSISGLGCLLLATRLPV